MLNECFYLLFAVKFDEILEALLAILLPLDLLGDGSERGRRSPRLILHFKANHLSNCALSNTLIRI